MKSLSPKWKFVEKRSSGAGANFYYVSKKFGIVVKLPYVTTGEHDTVYAKIYTEVIDVVDYFYIFIQPLATTSKKISEKVLDLLYKKPNGSLDLHDGNVGIFRNQAVVFDW